MECFHQWNPFGLICFLTLLQEFLRLSRHAFDLETISEFIILLAMISWVFLKKILFVKQKKFFNFALSLVTAFWSKVWCKCKYTINNASFRLGWTHLFVRVSRESDLHCRTQRWCETVCKILVGDWRRGQFLYSIDIDTPSHLKYQKCKWKISM